MNDIVYENNLSVDELKSKYPGDEFVTLNSNEALDNNEKDEGDVTFNTWYITLNEDNETIKTAWKKQADEW